MTSRWEIGSLFDLAPWEAGGARGRVPWDEHPAVFFGSGRGALVAAIESAQIGRLWVPSYLCQEVVAAASATGVALELYIDGPDVAEPTPSGARAGEGILVVDYFGLRGRWSPEISGAVVIEDHTHAPCSSWALESTADYCIASLRKLFPLADGGVVWSRRGRLPAPPPAREELIRAAFDKLSGMILKRRYLDGHDVDKDAFRELLASGESRLYVDTPASMTELSRRLLASFPLETWRQRRSQAFAAFADRLGSAPGVRLHRPSGAGLVPFSALVELETTELRRRVHAHACANQVYPSWLWPLDDTVLDVPEHHRDLSRRLLSFPIDMRYTAADLRRAAATVIEGRDRAGRS